VAGKPFDAIMAVLNTCCTFLETREALRQGEAARAAPTATPAEGVPATAPLRLLEAGDFPMRVAELLERSELPLDGCSDALQRLTEAGLIKLEPGDGAQIVALTPQGELLREV
jgi:hypothetical protein